MWLRTNPPSAREHAANTAGPTKREARKMAQRAALLRAMATDALTDGDNDAALEYDCAAYDIEVDLRSFGYSLSGIRNA